MPPALPSLCVRLSLELTFSSLAMKPWVGPVCLPLGGHGGSETVHSCPALGLGLFLQATGACSFSAFLLLRMLRVSQFLLLLVHRSLLPCLICRVVHRSLLLPCLICHWSHPVDSHLRGLLSVSSSASLTLRDPSLLSAYAHALL